MQEITLTKLGKYVFVKHQARSLTAKGLLDEYVLLE